MYEVLGTLKYALPLQLLNETNDDTDEMKAAAYIEAFRKSIVTVESEI